MALHRSGRRRADLGADFSWLAGRNPARPERARTIASASPLGYPERGFRSVFSRRGGGGSGPAGAGTPANPDESLRVPLAGESRAGSLGLRPRASLGSTPGREERAHALPTLAPRGVRAAWRRSPPTVRASVAASDGVSSGPVSAGHRSGRHTGLRRPARRPDLWEAADVAARSLIERERTPS